MSNKIKLEDNKSNKRMILYQGDDTDSKDWKYIDEFVRSFDSEKGYQDIDVILMRVSDGKYFSFNKIHAGAGYRETDFRGREVFPKTITTTVYE